MEIRKTNGVTKRYGKTIAMDNVSIRVNKGEIYGLLGLNGAGKTTLIRTLLGMIAGHNTAICPEAAVVRNRWR